MAAGSARGALGGARSVPGGCPAVREVEQPHEIVGGGGSRLDDADPAVRGVLRVREDTVPHGVIDLAVDGWEVRAADVEVHAERARTIEVGGVVPAGDVLADDGRERHRVELGPVVGGVGAERVADGGFGVRSTEPMTTCTPSSCSNSERTCASVTFTSC